MGQSRAQGWLQVTPRPTQGLGWARLEATRLHLLANAAKGNETPAGRAWLPRR